MNKTHLIGIGGIGMSALARILLDRKQEVSGSDLKHSTLIAKLKEKGVLITEQNGEALTAETTVVYSSAVASDNPEFLQAKKLGCPLLHRSDFLAELAGGYRTLAVTGAHGKTTISSLLAWVLHHAGMEPAFALGGILPGLDRNGRHGTGEYFVLEADESDHSFLRCDPYAAIISNIEEEHLEAYGTLDAMLNAYQTFIEKISNHLVWCGDDPLLKKLAPSGTSYGFLPSCDLQIEDFRQSGFSISFRVGSCEIQVPLAGRHNALNALAVLALCRHLGLEERAIIAGLGTFPGIARRLEKKGPRVFDDYAHHPTEVRATLSALRKAVGKRRIHAIFEPHRYTRMQACIDDFATSFTDADEVWVTEIYTAGEEPIPGIDRHSIIKKVGGNPFDLESFQFKPGDVAITLGAGNVTAISDALARQQVRVALVYGGSSPEHDVSVASSEFVKEHLENCDALHIPKEGFSAEHLNQLASCDVIFPMMHGAQGEDGLIAALAEALAIPYVGCDFRASSLCMNKALTKRIVKSHGIPTLPWVELGSDDPIPNLTYPLFVKPVHLGSSIGISKVENQKELDAALQLAFSLDDRVILEKAIVGRELHFALLGDRVAGPAEVLAGGAFNDYVAKYGQSHFNIDANPKLSDSLIDEGLHLAKKTADALGCKGMARIDFFLTDQLWLNEVNPIPGFSSNSTYPAIWKAHGLSPDQLFEALINYA